MIIPVLLFHYFAIELFLFQNILIIKVYHNFEYCQEKNRPGYFVNMIFVSKYQNHEYFVWQKKMDTAILQISK